MSHDSHPRLLIAQAIFLKGIADIGDVAAMTGLDKVVIDAETQAMCESDLAEERRGRICGYALTPEGTFIRKAMLADELRDDSRKAEIEGAYADFLGFNTRLLTVCTAWQLRSNGNGATEPNDHADSDYDAGVIEQLEGLHERVSAVLDRLSALLSRFGLHQVRLQNALDRLRAGEHDYFTKPMFPSYHSCWFELHEDLLATLGTERRKERSLQ